MIISNDKGVSYYNENGEIHREDGPAFESADGGEAWYLKGEFHRTDGPAIKHANGGEAWYLHGKLHRTDGAAVEYSNGCKFWYLHGKKLTEEEFNQWKESNMKNGLITNECGDKYWYKDDELHRDDGPAIERIDGYKAWYRNGRRHRTNGPAIEYPNGDKYWYINGKRHRTDGPAVEHTDGYKAWYKDDELHREDGPAIEYPNSDKVWYLHGKRHRTDGPAVEYANGNRHWFLHGVELTEEQFNQHKKCDMKKETVNDLVNDFFSDKFDTVNTNSILCSFVDLMRNSDNKFVYFYYGDDNAGSVMVYEDVEKQTGETKTRYEIYMKHVGNGYISVGFETENCVGDIQLKDAAPLFIRMSDMSEYYDRVLMDIRGYMGDVVKWPKEIISIMLQEVKIRKS